MRSQSVYFKSKSCDYVLKIISAELNVKGNVHDFIETYLEYKNKYLKFFEEEYESKYNEYKKRNADEKDKFINENLSKLPIHQSVKQIK